MPPANASVKVLLIDGDAFFASVCAARLESDGFSVRCATDGENGLRSALFEEPDVILLDLHAPRTGGLEALQALKKHPALRKIPVLMLAEKGRSEDAKRCFREGAVEYLAKTQLVPGDVARNVKYALQLS